MTTLDRCLQRGYSPSQNKNTGLSRRWSTQGCFDVGMHVSHWAETEDGLTREFRFEDFMNAFSFMTAVAAVAEAMDHHPDWCNSWNRVTITLLSHDVGRVTDRDRRLAEAIDQVALRFRTSPNG